MAIRPFADRSMSRKPLETEGSLAGDEVGVPAVLPAESHLVDQLLVALAIARDRDARIHLIDPRGDLDPRTMPGDTDVTTLKDVLVEWGIDVERRAVSTRQASRATQGYASSAGLDTVVLPAGEDGQQARIASGLECDAVTVKGEQRFRDFASMLVPVAGGPHAGATIDAAARVAAQCDAWIDLLHVLPEGVDETEIESTETRLAAIADAVDVTDSVTPWVLSADDAAETIIEQSGYYGLTVIGAPTSGRLRRFLYGSTSRTIREGADSAIMAVRTVNRDD